MKGIILVVSVVVVLSATTAFPRMSTFKQNELADRIEKIFLSSNATLLQAVHTKLATAIEKTFLQNLAAILVLGDNEPHMAEITTLMRAVLNGQVDFKPVVEKLPSLLRNAEEDQFIMILKALKETQRDGKQFGGLQDIGKIVDALGKFELKQVSSFLNEIPKLFESVEGIVESAEDSF